jgi:hypothetical protein
MNIKEVLTKHQLWLANQEGGERADLSNANLSDAYLSNANLRHAYLSGADLSGADLSGAYLSEADLSGADLSGAYLSGANLRRADLRRADLSGADLSGADLSGADLRRADLRRANLREADLRRAYLSGADLRHANLSEANLREAYLSGADLENTKLPHFLIVPESGSFKAWKKTTKGVIKIEVPGRAKRTNSLIGRKCRAEYIKVLGGEGIGGTGPNYEGLIYSKGNIIKADKYDDDIRVECTHGIHFFMTKKEAEEWN